MERPSLRGAIVGVRQDNVDVSDWQLGERLRAPFARLECGVLQLENPEGLARFSGSEIYQLMRAIRKALGRPVPDLILLGPVEPHRTRAHDTQGKWQT